MDHALPRPPVLLVQKDRGLPESSTRQALPPIVGEIYAVPSWTLPRKFSRVPLEWPTPAFPVCLRTHLLKGTAFRPYINTQDEPASAAEGCVIDHTNRPQALKPVPFK